MDTSTVDPSVLDINTVKAEVIVVVEHEVPTCVVISESFEHRGKNTNQSFAPLPHPQSTALKGGKTKMAKKKKKREPPLVYFPPPPNHS